jgi:hypothetical protein
MVGANDTSEKVKLAQKDSSRVKTAMIEEHKLRS